MRLFLLTILLCLHTLAQDTNTSQEDSNLTQELYIDAFHKRASYYVKEISDYADNRLVTMADYIDNKEANITQSDKDVTLNNKNAVDSFFLNDKYLDETDKSYISIRPEAFFSSKEDEIYNLKISAHLSLSKSKKRFRLFINDLDQDNANDVLADNSEDEKKAPEIGVNYFAPETYGILSKYSVGVRGIYPFVRARYSSEFHPGDWVIEPVQTLRYSLKDYFEESTEVFCDTKLTNFSLLRLYLRRGTKSGQVGMSYDGSMSLFWTPSKTIGLGLSQSFNGSTRYQQVQDEYAVPLVYDEYNGIFNYGTSASIRQNIFRPWFFYELRPGVNFHKLYDYEPNYTLQLLFDVFVGNL